MPGADEPYEVNLESDSDVSVGPGRQSNFVGALAAMRGVREVWHDLSETDLFGDGHALMDRYRCASPTPFNFHFLVTDGERLGLRIMTAEELKKGYFWTKVKLKLECPWSRHDTISLDPHAQALVSEQNQTSGSNSICVATGYKQCPDVNSRSIQFDSVTTLHGAKQCRIFEYELFDVAFNAHRQAFQNPLEFKKLFRIVGNHDPNCVTPKYAIVDEKVNEWVLKYFPLENDPDSYDTMYLKVVLDIILVRLGLISFFGFCVGCLYENINCAQMGS
jgi:hypothetical protein